MRAVSLRTLRPAPAAVVVAVGFAVLCPALARAQTISFASFNAANVGAGANQFTLNGNAALSGTALRVAPIGGSQTGSAFYNTRLLVSGGFVADYNYSIAGGSAADGLAFLVSNDAAGVTAIGSTGGAMGYQGLGADVLAVEMDQFSDVGVQVINGAGNSFGGPINPANGIRGTHNVRVEFIAAALIGTLNVYHDNLATPLLTLNNFNMAPYVNGAGTAFIGFSAATGGQNDNHDVNSFSFRSTPAAAAVPEPSTLALAALGASPFVGAVLRRRRAA